MRECTNEEDEIGGKQVGCGGLEGKHMVEGRREEGWEEGERKGGERVGGRVGGREAVRRSPRRLHRARWEVALLHERITARSQQHTLPLVGK